MSRSRVVMISGLITLIAAAAPAMAALKIGVVNYAVLLQRSPQARAAQAALVKEFGPRERALKARQAALKARAAKFQKNQAAMSADQRASEQQQLQSANRDLSQQISDYQDDFNSQQNAQVSKLQKMLVAEVQRYAQAQKFDLVFANGVIYATPALDITSEVLKALQAEASADPPAARRGSAH